MIRAAALLCSDCMEKVRCPISEQRELARDAFFALAQEKSVDCGDYTPRWWHGIEGVKQ